MSDELATREEPAPGAPSTWTGPVQGDARVTWGPGRVAAGILTVLVATLLEVGVISIFDSDLSSLGGRLAAQAALAFTLVGVAFTITAGADGLSRRRALGLRPPVRSPLRFAVAGYLAYVVVALVYSNFVHPHQRDITRDLGFGHGSLGTIVAAVLIIVAAPISEEIFFRGFVFGGLRSRFSFLGAAVASAAIFGVFHYSGAGSLEVLPQLALLGLVLCWVYEQTGSIYPTMAMHALNNALAFAILTS
jgi:membrane protease YdiL (CAAX protease family)